MKLIKLTNDHYVVVDDSEIKEGDWYVDDTNTIRQSIIGHSTYWSVRNGYKKITHSTKPIECDKMWTPLNGTQWLCNTIICCCKILSPKTKPISLSEAKAIAGEVDVEKKVRNEMGIPDYLPTDRMSLTMQGSLEFGIKCYNQALEDNKEKKYTEEDIIQAFEWGFMEGTERGLIQDSVQKFKQSLQPPTEWGVEFDENGKLCRAKKGGIYKPDALSTDDFDHLNDKMDNQEPPTDWRMV